MLAMSTVIEIQRLLDRGELSQRSIAMRLGVSRSTVGAIANGKRGLWGVKPEDDPTGKSQPAERCRECGYFVYKPCIICTARAFKSTTILQIRSPSIKRAA